MSTSTLIAPQKIQLRDYQKRILGGIYSYRDRHILKIVMFAPTGAGKTAMSCKLIEDYFAEGRPSLFIVRQEPLIPQTVATLKRFGLECGVIKAGYSPDPSQLIQVATIQTLNRRTFPHAELIVLDEAHGACAAQYNEVFERYRDSLIVGPTATPFRMKKKESLADRFDAITGEYQTIDLIENGYLSPLTVKAPPPPDLDSVSTLGDDYKSDELAIVMDTPEMIAKLVEEYETHTPGERAIAFCVNRQHSQNVANAFAAAGIPAETIDGDTPADERQAMYKRLRNEETLVLSSVNVLSEGFDEPSVTVGLMARPTKSRAVYIQQAGRILRLSPETGKTGATLLDQAGNCFQFKLPTERVEISLEPAKETDPGEAPMKRCPKCNTVVHAAVRTCPECGHIFEIEKAAAAPSELTEVTDLTFAQIRIKKLLSMQRLFGNKPGWVYNTYLTENPDATLPEYELLGELLEYKPGWAYHEYCKRHPEAQDLADTLPRIMTWEELQPFTKQPFDVRQAAWKLQPREVKTRLKKIIPAKQKQAA